MHGVSQLRTAETEKYAHVTYFFNGGVEQAFPGEERRLVPSNRDVATYDLAPEMSAAPVTDGVVEALKPGGPGFILVNYANPDMVGHTGKLKPAVSALETIDACIGRIVDRGRGREGDGVHHRRSRQLRDDDRSRDRPAAHRAHHQPDPVHRHRRRSHRAQAAHGRAPRRRGADRARPDGDPRSRRTWTAGACSNEHQQAADRSRARGAELAARQAAARAGDGR